MSSSTLKIETARAFLPLLGPGRYKAAWGGRGSGKSHFFAENIIRQSLLKKGLRAVCIREVQKSLKESAKALIEDKIESLNVAHNGFRVLNDRIETPGGGVIIFQGMNDHTAESIKSLEGFDIAWVEEAQTLSKISLRLLRPTIRKEGSEIWFSWNPRRKTDPVDQMFRQGTPPTGSVVVRANWSDNPWLPETLNQERKDCLASNDEQYEHIWEGGYIAVAEGAYFAKHMTKARQEGRLSANHKDVHVAEEPHFIVRLFADIGGTGAKSDNFVFWAAQFVGQQLNWINYYEAQGQPIGHHLDWMRSQGYSKDRVKIYLPHDGDTNDKVIDVSYQSAFTKAGFEVEVIPNQGRGAAKQRIERMRDLFPKMWFDHKCKAGTDALGWYHEKKDDVRNIGLGPEHDWSSHSSDAAGLCAICYEPPSSSFEDEIDYPDLGIA